MNDLDIFGAKCTSNENLVRDYYCTYREPLFCIVRSARPENIVLQAERNFYVATRDSREVMFE